MTTCLITIIYTAIDALLFIELARAIENHMDNRERN